MGKQTRTQVAGAPLRSSSAKTSASRGFRPNTHRDLGEAAAEVGVKDGGGHRVGKPVEPGLGEGGEAGRLKLCNGACDILFLPPLPTFESIFLFSFSSLMFIDFHFCIVYILDLDGCPAV